MRIRTCYPKYGIWISKITAEIGRSISPFLHHSFLQQVIKLSFQRAPPYTWRKETPLKIQGHRQEFINRVC
jgi:hypothetical protein